MPVDRWTILQLGVLLLALPAQYLLTKYMPSTESQRDFALQNLVTSAVTIKDKLLSLQYWQQLCMEILSHVRDSKPGYEYTDPDIGESPAIEVFNYRDPKGYFGSSPDPRSPRRSLVKYRVGQVIKHKLWGYRGIIIGWDAAAKAPESWLNDMHPADKPHLRHLPNYLVLVDTRDRPEPQKTYVVEENIQIVANIRVFHPETEDYFDDFDGAQYLPRPWLRTVYPHD